jgi:hypothetical protein
MNNFDFKLRMPIETNRNNDTITKVCVEDVSRILSRVQTSINKTNKDVKNLFKSVRKRYTSSFQDSEGYLVIGRGYSQPCHGDQFDEKTGNNIAFMKAKLNANFKKRSLLISAYNKYIDVLNSIDDELEKIESYILMDLDNLREYNPEYLKDIEYEKGILEKDEDPEEETDTTDPKND